MENAEIQTDSAVRKEDREAVQGEGFKVEEKTVSQVVPVPLPEPPKGDEGSQNVNTKYNVNIQPPVVHGFVSKLQMHTSSELKQTFFTLGLQIDDFNDWKTFILAKLELYNKVLKTYDGIRMEVPNEPEQESRPFRITTAAERGFDIYAAVKNLTAEQYRNLKANWPTISNRNYLAALGKAPLTADDERKLTKEDKDNDRFREWVTASAMDSEFQLMLALDEHWQQGLVPAREFWEWERQADDRFSHTAPLPAEFDDRIAFKWFESNFEGYIQLMDRNPEVRKMMLDAWDSIFREYTTYSSVNVSMAFSQLLEIFNLNPGKFSVINKLPAKIASVKSDRMVRLLISTALMGRWRKLKYPISFDALDIVTLFDIITARLFTTRNMWDEDDILDMDNYIAFHWLANLDSYRPGNIQMTAYDLQQRKGRVNHLDIILNSQGMIDNAVRNAIIPFFSCWADAGQDGYAAKPPGADRFMPQSRPIRYPYITGTAVDKPDDEFQQMQNFMQMLYGIRGAKYSKLLSRQMQEAIPAMFQKLGEVRGQYAMYGYAINLVMRKYSLCSLVYPIKNSDQEKDFIDQVKYRLPYELKAGDLLSLTFLSNWESVDVFKPVTDLVNYGWYVNLALNEITTKWYYLKDQMPYPYFKKIDRLEATFASLEHKADFFNEFKETIKHTLNTFEFPDVETAGNRMMERIKLADNFIKDNQYLMGYSDHYYYTRKYASAPSQIFDELYLADSDAVLATVDHTKYIELIQTDKMVPLVRKAKKEGKNIRFDLPVKLKISEFKTVPPENKEPTQYADHVKFGTIEVFYRWKETFVREHHYTYAFVNDPLFTVDRLPILDRREDYLLTLHKSYPAFKRNGFMIWGDFPRISSL